METGSNNDAIYIDIGTIFRVLLGRIKIILISACICGLLAFIVSFFIISPKYESTTKLYIINRQNEGTTTYSDIQTSTQLVKDYQVLVVSRPVVEQVISNLGLSIDTAAFIKNVDVNIATDSRVLSISVRNENPYLAKEIVDSLAEISAERICSVMQIDGVNIFEYGNIPVKPASPNVKIITLAGIILGFLAACAVVILIYMRDDSIKTSEDIENYLGISTLAMIPLDIESEDGGKNGKRGRK